ncbi:MAG: pre-peptidase C-terminal domain-containing protein [Planctomycetes bacterium]|nr:pre-peptidase C-terminal domain-containing protein [Planctomycetota bacterium]
MKKRRSLRRPRRAAGAFRPRFEPLEERRLLAVGAVGELRLTAADAAAADLLGESVAIDGDYLVVGSPGGDDGFADAGAAYVYRFDGSTWLEHERLLANDPGEGDGFGGSVAISGETIIVGAAGHDAAALAGAGAAYVFVLEGGSWVIQDKLLPDDGAAGDAFGSSVTIDGDVVAVGAITAATDVGAAYVFGRSDSVWSQQDKLLADGGLAGDGFGAAVDLSGDRIVVGAPGDDDGGDAAGAAYIFQRNESDWAFLSKLAASDSAAGDAFGASVAIGGSTVVVGATGSDNAGSAYIFVEQAGSWSQQQPLSAPDASAGDRFGSAVDIRIDGSGALVLVGAMHNKDAVDGAGAAYLFDRSGTDWNLRAKLAADDGATDDRFGAAVALGAQRLVIGSAGSDGFGGVAADDAGAAYAYLLNRFIAPEFLPRESRGNIEANELGEASGMVASRQSPGVLWAHNDSGGQRRVFAMDSRGEHLGIFGLDDVVHRDWEDIAIGPGPVPGVQYLYIADSGNNSAQTGNPHPNIRIYRVAEPVVDPDGGDQSASLGVVDTFTLTYPDEAWDNETLLVDPWTGDLVLVTKRAEFNHVYRLAAPGPGDLTAELEYVGNMLWGDQPPGDGSNSGIVGGDVSPTGREIILKNYHEIALFHRPLGISLAEALVGVIPELLPYEEMPKGEGLSFDAEGAGYFTLGERENRPDAPIDYYPRDFSSDIATVAEFQQGVVPTPAYDKAQDTLLQQTAPTANFGSSELLTVSGDDGAAGEDALAVLQWGDLSAVPSNSPIQAVSLTFDVTDATSGSGYQLFELRRDWSEGDASFNRATDDDAWQEPGAAGVDDRGTTVLGTVNPSTTGRFTMTLNQAGVDVVQSWVLDPSTNHGFLLVGDDNGDALSLSSSEATDPWLRPKLSIGFLRPDDVAPTAEIISPVDNGPLDQDPADDRLLLNPTPLFEFQLTDREVDDASVTSGTVVITRNDAPLIDGVDYNLSYDAATDRIRLTPISSKFDVGVYRITLSPAGQSIVDATGNEMLPREFFVSLDDSFPTPLEEVAPPGSLIYRRDTQGSIVSAGDSQTFSIDLDAGQTIAVVLSPAASLRPTIRVEGPAGELIGLPVEAAAVGDRTVLQAAPIDDAGAYKIFVGETGGTFGSFEIELILGAYAPASASPVVLDTAISLGGGADRLAALGQTGQQSYQFHLAAGQSATIALNALGTSAVNMELLKDGLRVALPATDATNVTHRIEGLGSLTDADYTVRVNAGGGAEYSLLVTRDAAFEIEPNNSLAGDAVDITRSGVVLGGFSSRELTSDFYRVSVTEGDVLDISTSAPGDGAGEPVNLLTLQLQLFDPAGQPVASGDQISFSDTVDGQYSIRVRTTGGTTGAYILRVEGHTGTPPAFAVAETTFDEVAGELTVDFNRSVSLASLHSSDLKINGQTARGFSIVDGQRVIFRVPQLSILAGSINMSIDAGLIEDLAGEPIAAFATSFSRPLFAAPPPGSLLYGQGIAGQIATAGATQQFLLELDSSQFVSLLLVPTSETLQPTLQLIGPGGEPQSFEAATAGESLITPPIDIDQAGAYTVVVGGVDDSTGDFLLQAIVNGLAENEEFLASTNDQMADAEDIDAGFADLDPAGTMQRAVVFGTANAALPDTVIDSGFNDSTEGFRYVDDAFNGTSNPERATGSREANGGFDGGALQVFLPRGGGFFGGLPRDPASGAWLRSFDLAEDASVEVALWYRLVLGQPLDADEFGEVILELDGVRLGTDQNDSLIHTAGNDGNDNSGWLFAEFTVDLSAGEHELKLGVYNNKSTSRNETVEARFDDVTVRVQGGGGPPKSDFYRFSLERDEVASLVLATFQDGAGQAPLALMDAAGEVLARSTVAGDGLTHSIDSFVAPATGTYFLHVSSTRMFPYSLLVTRGAAFNIEPNDDFATAQDISLVGGALGAVGAMDPLGDFYSLAVQQGDSLVIATSTPADGPFQPENNLDPVIELFDPSGNLVASDDNSAADGHNAQLEHTATASGLYRVRVFGAAETSGDYVLKIDGATGSVAPLRVTSSDPPAGALLRRAPSEITIDFSFPILRPDALDPAVLTVGGVAATGVSVIDGNTLRFDLPALEDATHEVVIAAAAISDIRGQANRAYHTELTIDSTGPRIISASIEEGSVLPAGSLSIGLTFDDQLNPLPLQSLGAVLFGEVTRRSYVADRVQYASELTTSTLTLEFDDLPEDIYTLRLPSGNRAIEDLAGNDLDGEAGAFPTGDGQPGGDFVLQFSLDNDELPLRPFERLQPLGSLIFASSGNSGIVNTSTDRDDHTFFVEAGEVVMATVTPIDPGVILTVELVGEAGGVISAPGAGQPVVLPATIVTTTGTKTLRIGGDVAGTGYTLDVYRNVVVELEDSSETSSLSIDASATGVGPGRLAVLGTSSATGSETIFATTGSEWKYLDDNSDQGTAWRELDFDDIDWKEGPSILGFGQLGGGFGGGEVLPIATTVDSGPQGARYITTYFRREFDVPDPSIYESLSLELLRDDGAAVYLNGERIALSNLADGAAFDMVAINDANPETAYLPFSVDPGNLRVGRNVLAVEVHQGSNNSSDLGMDAILIGTVSEAARRTVDSYTLDLTGLVGRSIDVVLAGQRGADYSGDLLELLDVDGATVLATATVDPLGVPADNYDLAILGFTVPAGGVYTLQLASSVPAGQYGIVVTTGGLFESEPNDRGSDSLRTLQPGITALGFLAEAGIDAFDVVLEAGQALTIAARPLLGTAPSTPENTLDPRLRLLDSNQVEVAADDNSAGGRGALLDFRADQAGTYTILVESVSGQGEYVLELLDSNAVRVVARHIFYNNSRFDGYDPAINAADDSAIAPDKQPLLNDEPAELANYTSFVSGINGIMVDVQNLADADDVNARQFVFRVGNTNDPDTWPLAPPPSRVTVREGAGINGSDRIVVTWPDGAIANTWLQITLRATIDTGLTEPDVFYVGNVVGDTGLGNQPDLVLVDQADRAATRSNSRSFFSPAPIDFPFDFNRDGLVDGVDRAIVRANLSAGIGGLILLNQAGGGPSPLAGLQFAVAAESPPIEADSQPVGVFFRPNERRSSARRAARRAAVRSVFDRLGRESVFSRQRATRYRYRAAGHGRLRIDARRDARIASVGRRRLAEAADLALETLIPDVVIESSRTNS